MADVEGIIFQILDFSRYCVSKFAEMPELVGRSAALACTMPDVKKLFRENQTRGGLWGTLVAGREYFIEDRRD